MIYLDNSATTKPCKEAVEAMNLAMTENWGNASALYGLGIDTAHMLRDARHKVAAALGAEPDRVFFTSGGTEADNWAIFSTAKRFGKKNKHIVTTAIEHHAVLHTLNVLEKEGFEITLLDVAEGHNITAQQVKDAIREDTCLVTCMYANNEIGSVLPISEIGAVCKEAGVPTVIVKCGNEMHQKILSRVGADRVIFPEKESGTRLAKNLLTSGFSEMIELSDEVSMVEIDVRDEWVGKTLIELSLRKKYSINVVAIRNGDKISTTVDPALPLEKGMQLIVIANTSKLKKLK